VNRYPIWFRPNLVDGTKTTPNPSCPCVFRLLVPSIAVADFFSGTWGKREYACEASPSLNIEFGVSQFCELLRSGNLKFPQVTCSSSDGPVNPLEYTRTTQEQLDPSIDFDSVVRLAELGRTIRISRVGEISPPLRKFAGSLEKWFSCKVSINAYYSSGETKGITPHYDSHHILVIQLEGSKLWNLGAIVADSPNKTFHPRPKELPITNKQIRLHKADVLYVPPGMWHFTSTHGVSLHLAIGIHPPDWSDLLSKALELATIRQPVFRWHLPFTATNDGCSYSEDLDLKLDKLCGLLSQEAKQLKHELLDNSQKPSAHSNSLATAIEPAFLSQPYAKQLEELLQTIWLLPKQPRTLALRGSAVRPSGNCLPWDIDIYFLTDETSGGCDQVFKEAQALLSRYPDLPEIDLTVMTRSDFLESDSCLLKRILLLEDGFPYFGENILSLMQRPAYDNTTASLLLPILDDIAERKLGEYCHAATQSGLESITLLGTAKRAAKAALRTVTALLMKIHGRFIRDPELCSQFAVEKMPEISRSVEICKAALIATGTNNIPADLPNAVNDIRRRVKEHMAQ